MAILTLSQGQGTLSRANINVIINLTLALYRPWDHQTSSFPIKTLLAFSYHS